MFRPNTTCTLEKKAGKTLRATRSYSDPVTASCSIVYLRPQISKTSVRADSSASRGAAEEIVAAARLLFPLSVLVEQDDVITVAGHALEVIGVEPKYTTTGRLDHYQADLRIKEGRNG